MLDACKVDISLDSFFKLGSIALTAGLVYEGLADEDRAELLPYMLIVLEWTLAVVSLLIRASLMQPENRAMTLRMIKGISRIC